MARIVFQLLITSFISLTSATVNVEFLRGITRFNNPSYWDYYFCCNAIGRTLIWEVNENRLDGFGANDIALVLTNRRSNFNSTASLLSVQTIDGRLFSYDSVLIVSGTEDLNLNVNCINGSMKNSANNSITKNSAMDSTSNSSVYLQYLFSQRIINMTSTRNLTSFFVCGVNHDFMNWQTSISRYTFSDTSSVGENSQNVRPSGTVVAQQAILLGREPYRLVTVLFSTDGEDITVSCGYRQNQLRLSSHLLDSVAAETTVELSDGTTRDGEPVDDTTSHDGNSGSTDAEGVTTPTPGPEVPTFDIVIASAVVVIVGLLTIIGIMLALVLICLCWYRDKERCSYCGYNGKSDVEKSSSTMEQTISSNSSSTQEQESSSTQERSVSSNFCSSLKQSVPSNSTPTQDSDKCWNSTQCS